MNKRTFLQLSAAAGLAGLLGCRRDGAVADPDVDYYTCTMHPSVHSHDPQGKCPICSMDLVPVLKSGATQAASATAAPSLKEFQVPVERQQQIGVTYATISKKPLQRMIRTVGFVAPDKGRQFEYVARVEAYIEKLEVTAPGESVEKEQPLLTIYSPDLATAERELITLLESRDRASGESRNTTERSLDAARRRLEQWNVSSAQIAELEKTRRPADLLTLRSPFAGLVESVSAEQGRKVLPGDPLMRLVDLTTVWVWAEFPEDEFPLLARGQKVHMTAAAYPGQRFEGEVSLLDPLLSEAKRAARARIVVANLDLKLRPGMYVTAELAVDAGPGLTIPVDAVLPTGERALVFVGRGAGKLEPRFIQLGRKFGDDYEVLGGLQEGERVVASANFLIDAEAKVQGAVKSFEAEAQP